MTEDPPGRIVRLTLFDERFRTRQSGDWHIASRRLLLVLGMTLSFFTIGHSTRSTAEFVDLLRASQIELVVDVRLMPRSRTNPQFNRERLQEELHRFQIGYVHLTALGGLRSRTRGIETSPNLLWENPTTPTTP